MHIPAVASEGHSSQVVECHGGLFSAAIISRADLPDELALRDDGTTAESKDVSTVPELDMSVSEAHASGSHDVVESGGTVSGDLSGPTEGLLDSPI